MALSSFILINIFGKWCAVYSQTSDYTNTHVWSIWCNGDKLMTSLPNHPHFHQIDFLHDTEPLPAPHPKNPAPHVTHCGDIKRASVFSFRTDTFLPHLCALFPTQSILVPFAIFTIILSAWTFRDKSIFFHTAQHFHTGDRLKRL